MSTEFLASLLLALPLIFAIFLNIVDCDPTTVTTVYASIATLYICGKLSLRIEARGIGRSLLYVSLFFFIGANAALSSACLARTAAPFADGILEEFDNRIFLFRWPVVLVFMRKHPVWQVLLSHAYVSLNWQPILLLTILGLKGDIIAARRFLIAWTTALILTLLIFPFVPALGAFAHFHVTQEMLPGLRATAAWRSQEIILALRDGSMQVLNDRALEGIVTMPSFHAAAAILLGLTYWSIKSLRWLFLTLNAIMLASAVPVGGHYLVDVVAGSVIAAASILISHRILPICSGAFRFEHSRAARCAFLFGLH